jgi:hypothetical protein
LPDLVDHPHPAAAQILQEFVVAEGTGRAPRPNVGGVSRVGRGDRVRDRLGQRPLGRRAQRLGPAVHPVLVGEELLQLLGQVGVAGEQFLHVRRLAGFARLEVRAKDLVQTPLPFGHVNVFHGRHSLTVPLPAGHGVA